MKFLDRYYIHLIALTLFISLFIYLLFFNSSQYYIFYLICFCFASVTAIKEKRDDISWKGFLLFSTPVFLIISIVGIFGYDIWSVMLNWQLSKQIVFDLNESFKNIPFNDASFARIYKNDLFTYYFRLVYNTGFQFAVVLPIYRAAISKDLKKVVNYTLSTHVLQVILISPFYRLFHLQEVWYVLNEPDGLARTFKSAAQAAGWVINCFPSMHTSIAFAVFLIVLKEKDKLFKYIWSFYCLSIIYSTMYLEIHWVIDVFAGLLLGFAAVKLGEILTSKLSNLFKKPINQYLYKNGITTDKNYSEEVL